MSDKAKPIKGRPQYVVDQKAPTFADRRTRRLRTRAAALRAALRLQR